MAIRAVFFDVGETLVDETRHWGLWADHLGVPRFTFYAALGSVISEGRHHRDVFKIFNPDFDYHSAWQDRVARGESYEFLPSDFYPDAIACLRDLKGLGYEIGIAGNQPEGCEGARWGDRLRRRPCDERHRTRAPVWAVTRLHPARTLGLPPRVRGLRRTSTNRKLVAIALSHSVALSETGSSRHSHDFRK